MSYQSWEMASGPSVAYKMAGRSNGCAVVESPKGPIFSNFRVQDTISRGFTETPKSSNYRVSSSQENVVRGLSALSLRGQSQQEADSPSEENRSVSLSALCCAPPELYRCLSPRSNEGSSLGIAQSSGCWKPLNSNTSACNNVGFVASSEVGNQGSILHIQKSATANFSPLNTAYRATVPIGFHCGDEVNEHASLGSFSNMLRSSSSSLQSRIGTSKVGNLEPDTISESSFSSGDSMLLASSSSSGEASQLSDDTEAQSAYKEPTEPSFSVGASSLPRKGLSKFYAGKSRSFSCLRDVVSVKDLAKPETPHGKKRRVNSSSSGLPPLQKGAASISKKPLHSGKSTLALAVAMNTKEDYQAQASIGPPRYQKSVMPSRSFSLSDLQGAAVSLFFIG